MNIIYHLITSVQLGGAEIIAMELAEHCRVMPENRNEFVVVELFSTDTIYASDKKDKLASKRIPVITLFKGKKRVSLVFAPFMLIKYIIRDKPTIIHSHTDLPDLVLSVAIRISKLFNIKSPSITRTIHSTQLWRTRYLAGKFTESAFRDERVVAVSSFALSSYEQLRNKYRLPVSVYKQVIYNGSEIPVRLPHRFNIDKKKINIAFCGRFEDYKGMETLIPAISRVSGMFPSRFLFHVIGDGTYKKNLMQLSRNCSDLILYNPISNISSLLYDFDYLFMPSHFEGLPLISIEASLSRVPVIASYAPGLDETLPEDWPLKFHLDNEDELYSIFNNIDKEIYSRNELGENSFRFASDKFSLEKMLAAYTNLYNDMI